jgi:uncharacterized RmlC-like cupin family protein
MKLEMLLLLPLLIGTANAQSATKSASGEVFSADAIASQQKTMVSKSASSGSAGVTLGDYGTHSIRLSTRSASGGAEVHAHFDDVMYVTGGVATLLTGGTVIDPKISSEGETAGSGIRDGASRRVAKGDVIHVPAGVPHQLQIAPGTTFSAIVVKVKE